MFKKIVTAIFLVFLSNACTNKTNIEPDDSLHLVFEQDIKTLDPIKSADNFSSEIIHNIYEGLYSYHFLKRPIELVPLLAESLPEISENGTKLTVKIKKNIFFHDSPAFPGGKGREVTAEDFIYSWKRNADPNSGSVNFWLFDNKISGINEWRESVKLDTKNFEKNIPGLQSLDKYTLVITLNQPNYQFIHQLVHQGTKVVPREAVEYFKQDFSTNPVGTGPYIISSWTKGYELVLQKNVNYHEVLYPSEGEPTDIQAGFLSDAGKKLPLTKKINIKFLPQEQSMWLSFLRGKIDHAIRIPANNFDSTLDNGKLLQNFITKGIQLRLVPRPDVTYIGFNHEYPLFKNKKFRQAMVSSFDNNTFLKVLHKNKGIVANGPIPPQLDGFDPNFKNPFSYNLEQAKKLMSESGLIKSKKNLEIPYEFPGTNSSQRIFAEYDRDQFEKIGVKIKLNSNSWPAFDQKIKTKQAPMFDMAWSADYPDGENFLQLFYCKNSSPGPNAFNYCNSSYDKMYEASVKMSPGPDRTAAYKKMVEFLTEDAVAIFNVHRTDYFLYHGWLKNYKKDRLIYDFYKYLRVDPVEKEKLLKKL